MAFARWPRLVVGASLGAALLSTAVALYVVFGGSTEATPPTPPTDAAAPNASAAPIPSTPAAEVAAHPSPPPAIDPPPSPWPDLALEGLPAVGAAPESMGQSVGSPRDGALLHPAALPAGRGYLIRNEHTAWGTDNTIEHLRTAIKAVRRRHSNLHRVVIGDISTRRGGPLPGHQSHQAGRDVDVGLYYRSRAEGSAAEFEEADRDNLDRRATFDLLMALSATRDDPTGVKLIVLDYGLQRLLRKAAQARGVSETKLEALFQYPHGPTSQHGLIRHKPAHRDHMHVRFGCPSTDPLCRAPLIGFAGMEAAQPVPSP